MSQSSLCPPGSLEVTCSFPGCGLSWWVDPASPAPLFYDCGGDHHTQALLDKAFAGIRLKYGYRLGTMSSTINPNRTPKGVGPKSECADFFSATAYLKGRKGIYGSLSWTDPVELADIDATVARIVWDTGNGMPSNEDECPDHMTRWIVYRVLDDGGLESGVSRKYVLGHCALCNDQVLIDLAEPGHHEKNHSLPWGSGFIEKPEWLKKPVYCYMGLSGESGYGEPPCVVAYSSMLEEWEKETGARWTFWEESQFLFYDPITDRYGLLAYTDSHLFWDKNAISAAIQWGTLGSLQPQINSCTSLYSAIDRLLPPKSTGD